MRPGAGWLAALAAVAVHATALAFVRLPAPQDPVMRRAVPIAGPRLTYWPTAPPLAPADVVIPPSPPAERQIVIQRRRQIHPPPTQPPRPPEPGDAPLPPLWRGAWELAPPLAPLLAALAEADRSPRASVDGVVLGLPAKIADEPEMLADPPEVIAGLGDSPPAAADWRWSPDAMPPLPEVSRWLAESGSTVWRGERDGVTLVYLPLAVRAGWEARRPESLVLWRSLVRSLR